MPWSATSPIEERIRFVKDERAGLYTMSELCERYGISRKTGYKRLDRFEAEGAAGLVDRSRAPHHCEIGMSEAVRERILDVRRRGGGAQRPLDRRLQGPVARAQRLVVLPGHGARFREPQVSRARRPVRHRREWRASGVRAGVARSVFHSRFRQRAAPSSHPVACVGSRSSASGGSSSASEPCAPSRRAPSRAALTSASIARSRRPEQRRFDRFREDYNEQRPHEALHQATPASRGRLCPRTRPARGRSTSTASSAFSAARSLTNESEDRRRNLDRLLLHGAHRTLPSDVRARTRRAQPPDPRLNIRRALAPGRRALHSGTGCAVSRRRRN
jgi:hypothetical protein